MSNESEYVSSAGLGTSQTVLCFAQPNHFTAVTGNSLLNGSMFGEIKERIRKRYERERIKIEKLLTLGYTTSGDP